ncbi:hypothetical protein ABTA59_19640, partial [Acinetobacter baumannii]
VAVLVEDFAGALGRLGLVAVVDAGHQSPWVSVSFFSAFPCGEHYSRADAGATCSSQNAAAILIEIETVRYSLSGDSS